MNNAYSFCWLLAIENYWIGRHANYLYIKILLLSMMDQLYWRLLWLILELIYILRLHWMELLQIKVVDWSAAAGDEKWFKQYEDGSTILKNILAYFIFFNLYKRKKIMGLLTIYLLLSNIRFSIYLLLLWGWPWIWSRRSASGLPVW